MISTESNIKTYNCTGSQTVFPITFPYSAGDTIYVFILNTVTEVETRLTPGAEYSISNKNVVTVSTYSADYKLVIVRLLSLLQGIDLHQPGVLAHVIEQALDNLTLMVQQHKEKLGRAVLFKQTSSESGHELPDPENECFLRWLGGKLVNSKAFSSGLSLQVFMEAFLEAADAAGARTTLDVYSQAEHDADVDDLAGAERTTETVKDNAYDILNHNHDAAYLGLTAKAADSELLDNHDSSYFSVDGHIHDGRYFTESEHLNVSAGAGDAGKPIKLDAAGHVDASMINDGDVAHANIAGTHNLTTDIDHDTIAGFVEGEHRIINDAGTLTTELFSASKIISDLSGKSGTGHDHDADYLGIGDKAADSELLDNHDSTYFSVSTHNHSGVYEPVFSKNSAFNKNFAGTGAATTVGRSDHNHNTTYLGLTDKAANSELLDGLDSTEFSGAIKAPTEGLVGWWTLDDGEGINAIDSSGNGNDGALINAPDWVDGKSAKCLSFNGIDEYVKGDVFITEYPFTISAWVKFIDYTIGGGIAYIVDESGGAVYYGMRNAGNGKIQMDARGAEGISSTQSVFSVIDNIWYHLVFVFTNAVNRILYIDGQLDKISTDDVPFDTNVDKFLIGKLRFMDNICVNSLIDEVRIYNRVLSHAEVLALFIAPGGYNPGLITPYRLEKSIWHAGNDGSGSGLDADKLDNHEASYFSVSTHNHSGVYLPIAGTAADSDKLDAAHKDTDGTLSGNSDSSIPTEKAVKTYVDNLAGTGASYKTGWIYRGDFTNVHLGSDTTLNTDSDVAHNFGVPLSDLLVTVLISTTGSDTDCMVVYDGPKDTYLNKGITLFAVDNNNIQIQTGNDGFMYVTPTGGRDVIDTIYIYYKIVVKRII